MKRAMALAAVLSVFVFAGPGLAYFCGDPDADQCAPVLKKEGGSVSERRPSDRPASRKGTPDRGGGFILRPDESLEETLHAWSRTAGWTVVWRSVLRIPVKARYVVSGPFPAAVSRVIQTFNETGRGRLRIRLYPANRVLVVEDR